MAERRRTTAPPPQGVPVQIDPYKLQGKSGLVMTGGRLQDEWLVKLRGKQGLRAYREMADNEPVCGAILTWLEAQLRAVETRVVPSDENNQTAVEWAEFVSSCMDDMDDPWEAVVSNICSQFWAGFALLETVYKKRDDGRIGWRRHDIRAAESIEEWDIDEEGTILGAWQQAAPDYRRTYLPMDKCLLFRTTSHKNNPEGRSIFRTAYVPYQYVKVLRELEAIGAERDLVGLPDMQVPTELLSPTATQEQAAILSSLVEMLGELRVGERSFIVRPTESDRNGDPTGYKLGVIQSGGAKSFDIDKVIRRHESRMAMSVLSEFIFLGTEEHGSRALADTKTSVSALAMRTHKMNMQATLNRHAVARLMQMNGVPRDLWPTIELGDFEKPDLGSLGAFVSQMVQASVFRPDAALERHLRSVAELPEADDVDLHDTPEVDRALMAMADAMAGDEPQPAKTQPAPTQAAEPALDSLASAIERLVRAGDMEMANAARAKMAKMLGIDAPAPLTREKVAKAGPQPEVP